MAALVLNRIKIHLVFSRNQEKQPRNLKKSGIGLKLKTKNEALTSITMTEG